MRVRDVTIKTKVVLAAIGIFIAISVIMSFFIYKNQLSYLGKAIEEKEQSEAALFPIVEAEHAHGLVVALAGITRIESLLKPFTEKNREKLLAAAKPVFDDIKTGADITQMYFIEPDGMIFLRVHKPEQHGDYLKGEVYEKASGTKKNADGIEMGKNFLSQRSIQPMLYKGTLIGYLEVAQDVISILKDLKEETGDDTSIFLTEEFLKSKSMEAGKEKTGEFALLYSSDKDNALKLAEKVDMKKGLKERAVFVTDLKGLKYLFHAVPFRDASGNVIGILSYQRDVSNLYSSALKNILFQASVLGLLLIAVISLFIIIAVNRFLLKPLGSLREGAVAIKKGRFDYRIPVESMDEIGVLADNFNDMAQDLNQLFKDKTQHLQELVVLNKIATAASQSLSLEVMLQRVLNTIFGLEHLALEEKGAILLFAEDKKTLKLIVSRNFSDEHAGFCATVPYGECLCGICVEKGEIIVSGDSEEDKRHSRTYPDAKKHGHIVLPLKAGDKMLGVLCLYLSAGIKFSGREIEMYKSIANIISASLQNVISHEEIQQNEAKLREAQRIASLGNWEWDIVKNTLYWSDENYRIFGLDPDKSTATYEAFLNTIHPDDRDFVQKAFNEVLYEGKPYSIDHRIVLPDGAERIVHEQAEVTFNESGKPIKMSGTVQDVTERKLLEDNLKRHTEELLSLAEASNVILTTTKDRYDSVCHIAVRKFGLKMSWIGLIEKNGDIKPVGESDSSGVYRASLKVGLDESLYDTCLIVTAIKTKTLQVLNDLIKNPCPGPCRGKAALSIGCKSLMISPLVNTNSEVTGIIGFYGSETEFFTPTKIKLLNVYANQAAGLLENRWLIEGLEKKVKERTAELETANTELKKLFNAIEQSEESVIITDINGTIQYVNPVFSRRTGYSREEAIGGNPRILQSGLTPVEVYDEMWKTIVSGRTWKGTLINKKRSGELYYEDATIAPVFDKEGNITNFVAVKADVTNRITAEKELKDINSELLITKAAAESANKAKSDFLANMSHELRTPLNAILGFSEALRDGKAGAVTNEQKEYLQDIWESGRHLLRLISDILDISKIEAGMITLELGEVDIRGLIAGCVMLFKEKSLRHGIELTAEVSSGVGDVIADELKVKQIILNLLGNAFKFTPDGGKIGVDAALEGDELYVSVWDTGIGIAEQDIGKLFRPFEQLEKTLTKKYEGTGLGLSICKKFVELHGGRIWVESLPGTGSRFTFLLPAGKKM